MNYKKWHPFPAAFFFTLLVSAQHNEMDLKDIIDKRKNVEPSQIGTAEVAAKQAVPDALGNISINMVTVIGGTFTMGCSAQDGGYCDDDESPAHSITVNSFKLGKYEVTQSIWQDVMGNNPSQFSSCSNCPVEQVSWQDVQVFISKLNEKTGMNFRLPTEAEWEYAARGGGKSRGYIYSGGTNNSHNLGWWDDNSEGRTHAVGQKEANELGIFDMTGNVWEWCADWYGANYYTNSPSSNPKGPDSGEFRVVRGGSWDSNDGGRCRVADRGRNTPNDRSNNYGLRLAHDL